MRPNCHSLPSDPWQQGGRRRRLQEVFSGYDIERWPISVPPHPDEPLRSWVRRLSYRYGLTPRQLNQALGLPQDSQRNPLTVLLEGAQDASAALGVDPRDIAQNLPADNKWRPDLAACFYPDAGFYPDTGRFCPQCLAEDSTWRLEWESRWSLACPRHHTLYQSRCPSCGQRPWRSRSWYSQSAASHQCTERQRTDPSPARRRVRSWCLGDLRLAPEVPASPDLLAAQDTIRDRFADTSTHQGGTESFGPFTLDPTSANDLLATLLREAIRYYEPQRGGVGLPERVLLAYHAFLDLHVWEDEAPALDELLGSDNVHRLLHPSTCTDAALGEPVILAWYINRHRGRLSYRMQLACRTERAAPSLPAQSREAWEPLPATLVEHGSEPARPPAEWIPQLMPPQVLALPWASDPLGRALGSMCFLNLGRGNPWSHAAVELGLPRRLQHHVAGRLRRVHQRQWSDLLRSMEDYFNQLLHDPPPINYRARRLVANDPLLLQTLLAEQLGTETNTPLAVLRLVFWEQYTGGHALFAPPRIAIGQNADPGPAYPNLREDALQQCHEGFEHLAEELDQRAEILLAPGTRVEPP
ncbi:hypothetical protein KFL01_27700 [Kocuria flava]|uniref:TniQ domain-containing protein n=2 Tax=Kocuria flava TaxID=446860 RepID=A0ABQ0XC59_9MICC|nr:hypothetical protein KFL01_27700 [Kocuria flava]